MGRKREECSKLVSNNYFFNFMLDKLGLSKDMIGYYYLIEILDLLINEGMEVRSFSKQVYPIIAGKYHRNAITVERDIRSCINAQWETELKDKLSHLWKYEKPPTCRKFIFLLKAYIMQLIA